MGAIATAVGALAVLTSIHERLADAGADVVLVASLLTLAHAVFRLVDDREQVPADDREQPPCT